MARPLEHNHSMCPECHQPTAYFDGHFHANMCTNRTCTFHEPVEKPQMMTKWDVIDLINDDEDVQNAIWAAFERRFEVLWEEAKRENAEDETMIEAPKGNGFDIGD